jgi:hypothetical protein
MIVSRTLKNVWESGKLPGVFEGRLRETIFSVAGHP